MATDGLWCPTFMAGKLAEHMLHNWLSLDSAAAQVEVQVGH